MYRILHSLQCLVCSHQLFCLPLLDQHSGKIQIWIPDCWTHKPKVYYTQCPNLAPLPCKSFICTFKSKEKIKTLPCSKESMRESPPISQALHSRTCIKPDMYCPNTFLFFHNLHSNIHSVWEWCPDSTYLVDSPLVAMAGHMAQANQIQNCNIQFLHPHLLDGTCCHLFEEHTFHYLRQNHWTRSCSIHLIHH